MGIRPLGRTVAVLLIGLGVSVSVPQGGAAAADWVAPLPEPLNITRDFDPPDNPYGSGHRGVDIAGQPTQEVGAAGAGTVVYAGPLAGRGVVSIEHAGDLRTTYEQVSATVSAGMTVGLGQIIGTLEAGHPGCPVTACLHWGLKRGDHYLNPLLLLARVPVRLLPRYGASQPVASLDPVLAAGPAAAASWAIGVSVLPASRRRKRIRPADGPGGRRT